MTHLPDPIDQPLINGLDVSLFVPDQWKGESNCFQRFMTGDGKSPCITIHFETLIDFPDKTTVRIEKDVTINLCKEVSAFLESASSIRQVTKDPIPF